MATWNCSGVESSVPATRPTTVVSVSWSTVLPVAPGASSGGRLARRTDSPAPNTAVRAPGTGHGTCGRGWAERVSSPYGEDLFRLTVTSGAGTPVAPQRTSPHPGEVAPGGPGVTALAPRRSGAAGPSGHPATGPPAGPGTAAAARDRARSGTGHTPGGPLPACRGKKLPKGLQSYMDDHCGRLHYRVLPAQGHGRRSVPIPGHVSRRPFERRNQRPRKEIFRSSVGFCAVLVIPCAVSAE